MLYSNNLINKTLLLCTLSLSSLFGYCEMPCTPYVIYCPKGAFSVDAIYWRAFEGGFEKCYPTSVSDVIADGHILSTLSGISHDPHFKWNAGLRAGYEYEVADAWDMACSFTHFYSRAHHFEDNGSFMRLKLCFDTVDLIARYKSPCGSCFILKPYLGLRGAKINQRVHLLALPDLASSTNFVSTEDQNREKFSGIGPLAGIEADWDLGKGFSCYANASVSCLYGTFKIRLINSEVFTDSLDFSDEKKHLKANLACADAELGIRYQRPFFLNTFIVVQLGLEHHRYFDYNQLAQEEDLCFDGVNFSVGLIF